jgi:hypothetical protein
MGTAIQAVPQAVSWLPSDNGMVIGNGDPLDFTTGGILTAGSVYLMKLIPRYPGVLLSNLWFFITAAGVGASTGSFAGVYSNAGQLLTGSADIGAQLLGGAGPFEVPLLTPQLLSAPVWATIVANLATTQPTLLRGQSTGTTPNVNLPTSQNRFGIAATLQTVLPASFTPSAMAGPAGGTYIVNGS